MKQKFYRLFLSHQLFYVIFFAQVNFALAIKTDIFRLKASHFHSRIEKPNMSLAIELLTSPIKPETCSLFQLPPLFNRLIPDGPGALSQKGEGPGWNRASILNFIVQSQAGSQTNPLAFFILKRPPNRNRQIPNKGWYSRKVFRAIISAVMHHAVPAVALRLAGLPVISCRLVKIKIGAMPRMTERPGSSPMRKSRSHRR